jgi:hypothetical protein
MSRPDDATPPAPSSSSGVAPLAGAAPLAPTGPLREVPVAWEALEDGFENNAPEVHSYLHTHTGEVIRIVDGIADPEMHRRVMGDTNYLRVEPVSSREQYRWMERFIATVEEGELRDKLVQAIDGKGAFRRFKDVLMSFPVDRERWFTFRSERLRSCMEGWLETHRIVAVPRKEWRVPTADEVQAPVDAEAERPRKNRAALADAQRKRLHELGDQLPARELDVALAFLEFLRERKHLPRLRLSEGDEHGEIPADDEHTEHGASDGTPPT